MPKTNNQNATNHTKLKAAITGLIIKKKAIIKLKIFKIKLNTKYPVENARKCHDQAIPTTESTKNQIANQ